jgi:hypothetical protein
MVVQEKKTIDLWICVDLGSLNATCVHDPFPTLFIDKVLENVGGNKAYLFMDGFLCYDHVYIVEEDISKTMFVMEWGSFTYNVMPFGLC